MASRGSVIPFFVEQIKNGLPITVTDPNMTRYLMSLEEAVDLVMFAYANGNQGDLLVQKAPASTIGDLAQAIREIFHASNPIEIIGNRHGENPYETLCTREEMARAEDLGNYFRVPADNRDLNYGKFFFNGDIKTSTLEDYNSHNTHRLTKDEVVKKLLDLEYIKNELASWGKANRE